MDNPIDIAAREDADEKLAQLHRLRELRTRSTITGAFLAAQIAQEELRLLKEADGNLQMIHDLELEDVISLEYKTVEARCLVNYYRELCLIHGMKPEL